MNEKQIADLLNEIIHIKNETKRQEIMNILTSLDISEIPLLIQDDGKSYWRTAVEIIKNIGYPRNISAIPKLVELLQDLNWPGAEEALEVLQTFEISVLVPYIEVALFEAKDNADYIWISGINKLIILRGIKKEDFLKKDAFDLLELSE